MNRLTQSWLWPAEEQSPGISKAAVSAPSSVASPAGVTAPAFTAQQQVAIAARGNVLVTAGAGTGKTRTLVARALRLIAEDRLSFDDLLLVTFTEAAAAEMRGRIRMELRALQAARPDDDHLAGQLTLLDTARISTLHSFCLQLVREHFHRLSLDPQFGVLDEQQTAPLMRAALDDLLEEYYNGTDPGARAVQELITSLGRGADKRVRSLVTRLHRYSRSLPDPERWLEAQQHQFEQSDPVQWREWFPAAVSQWCKEWRDAVGVYATVAPAARLCHNALMAAPAILSVVEAAAVVRAVSVADQDDANWPRGTVKHVRDPLKRFFSEAEFFRSLVSSEGGNDPLVEDWNWSRNHLAALIMVAREFGRRFERLKRDAGGLDFADLEQCALRLLHEPAVAMPWRERLAQVFVDEYQDITEAQDRIISLLSRDGGDAEGNRFLVGDVKQSIYRFRLAQPKIFRGYDERWGSGRDGGVRVALTGNFRSREVLLNFINSLFAATMRVEIGGIEYEPLQFGMAEERGVLRARSDDSPRVELHVIARDEDNGEASEPDEENGAGKALEDLRGIECEARLVARRLKELQQSGHPIWSIEERRLRPVEWRDMTVLLRSPAGRAEFFAKEFARAGVPLAVARDGFFNRVEVSDLLNLLRLLDNPLQDLPLLAVLRSPLVGFSLDELVHVRLAARKELLWTALQRFHREHPRRTGAVDADELAGSGAASSARTAWRKTDLFLRQIARWRELARTASLTHCLEVALSETHYEALLQAAPRGEEQRANVRRLLDLAQQFDPFQRQGLYRFLRFVEMQEEEESDLPPASVGAADGVKLMSAHKSKGLEFPVVVLAGLGTRFNENDLRDQILLSEQYGLCSRITPPDRDESYPGLAYWLARRDELRELRGEELRLLYVALTRAQDTLILVGTANRKLDAVTAGFGSGNPPANGTGLSKTEVRTDSGRITTAALANARSQLDWLMLWLSQSADPADWRDERQGENALVRWQIHGDADSVFDPLSTPSSVPGNESVSASDRAHLERIEAQLEWNYPCLPLTTEPAKASVSVLRRQQAQWDDEAAPLLTVSPPARRRTARGLSAADVGTAHHLFLQMASLDGMSDASAARLEVERLRERGWLTTEEADAVDVRAVTHFWSSPFGKRILEHLTEVQREMPFTARFDGADLRQAGLETNLSPGEFVVVQGVADLVVLRQNEIWLVDFKTDDVAEAELPARVALYAPQLKLYALALSGIYRRPVKECCLYFLSRRVTVPISLNEPATKQSALPT